MLYFQHCKELIRVANCLLGGPCIDLRFSLLLLLLLLLVFENSFQLVFVSAFPCLVGFFLN